MAMNLNECAIRSNSIPAGGTFNIIFTSGPSHCVFLDRLVGFNGSAAKANVYRNPTYTSGDVVPFFAIDTSSGVLSTSVFISNPTVSNVGTQVGATSYYRGSNPIGNGTVGTYGTQRGKRRLSPHTTYLLQFTNDDANPQTIDVYFRWYEGPMTNPGGV